MLKKLASKTVATTKTMRDFFPLFSTIPLRTQFPLIEANEAMIMQNQAQLNGTSPRMVYCTLVLQDVNSPMKLLVHVLMRGSRPIMSRMGPITSPPAIPSEPAKIPAMKHTTIILA